MPTDYPILTAQKVEDLLLDCLFPDHMVDPDDPQIPEGGVEVDAILCTFGFDPEKLEKNKYEIRDLIRELPETFDADSEGGGWSFLAACYDRHGNHWGEHKDMENLFALGLAVGLARFLIPRSMWQTLPGGMPYIQTFPNKEPRVKTKEVQE